MVIPGDNSGKRADSAADKGFCAYDFDFFVFLYAFSGEKREFEELAGPWGGRRYTENCALTDGRSDAARAGKVGRCGVTWL